MSSSGTPATRSRSSSAGEVAGVVVRVAEGERLRERAALADRRTPDSLKSSNGFATIAASPIASACISAATGTSARSHHVGVQGERRALVERRELLRRGGRVHRLVPRLGELGRRQRLERREARLEVLERVGMPAALQLEPRRRGAEPHVGARLDRAERVHRGGRHRLAELVAPLVGVARRLAVAEPVVPARRRRRRSPRGRGTSAPGAPARRPRAAARGSRRSRGACARPSASDGRRSSRRPRSACRPRRRPRSTPTAVVDRPLAARPG